MLQLLQLLQTEIKMMIELTFFTATRQCHLDNAEQKQRSHRNDNVLEPKTLLCCTSSSTLNYLTEAHFCKLYKHFNMALRNHKTGRTFRL